MSYTFDLICRIVRNSLKNYEVLAIIGIVILTAFVGSICRLSGGDFWEAVAHTLEFCFAICVAYVTVAIYSASKI